MEQTSNQLACPCCGWGSFLQNMAGSRLQLRGQSSQTAAMQSGAKRASLGDFNRSEVSCAACGWIGQGSQLFAIFN